MTSGEDRWILVARVAIALVLLSVLGGAWPSYGPRLLKAYELWRYPAIRAKPTLGADLKRTVDTVRRAEARGQFDRVKALLDAASADGLGVASLYEKLPTAVRMINAGQFEYARVHLSSIEARIPRKREVVAPANPELDEDTPPTPPPPPARRKPVKKARR